MSDGLKKYLPWILTVVAGFIALHFGTTIPDPVKGDPVVVHDTVTVFDTVVVRGKSVERFTVLPGATVEDSARALAYKAQRDSLNQLIVDASGRTYADVQEIVTIPLKDSSYTTLSIYGVHDIETMMYEWYIKPIETVIHSACEQPSEFWQWIERGIAFALVIATQLIK